MYASLHGLLLDKASNTIHIDVNGVGYEVTIPLSTFQRLPNIGSEIFIFTHLRVLEDSHTLYGFATAIEKKLFQELIKINKVGPKMAISVLSLFDSNSLLQVISAKDKKAFEKVPGIGKATSEKMMIELNNKMDHLLELAALGRQQMKNVSQGLALLANRRQQAQASLNALPSSTASSSGNASSSSSENALTNTSIAALSSSSASGKGETLEGGLILDPDEADFEPSALETVTNEARYALVNLGLKEQDARAIINKVYEDGMNLMEVIKKAFDLYNSTKKKIK